MNRTSVNALLDMGFAQEQIVEALNYLKKQKNYSPVGELDRALDLLYREQSMKSNRSHQSNNQANAGAAGGNGNAVLKL